MSGAPPYVVAIESTFADGKTKRGSAVIIDGRGGLLTCNHVVASTAALTSVVAKLPYPFTQPVPYRVAQPFPKEDAALLRPEVPLQSRLPAATADRKGAEQLQPNDELVLWGFSTGDLYAVAQPIPSVFRGYDTAGGCLGVSGSVNPGDSGGAVLRNEKLVGLIRFKDSKRAAHALAVPITLVPESVFEAYAITPVPDVTDAFAGRENEIEEIHTMLTTKRFVTLTGLPGIGKSECAKAVAVAAGSAPWCADGIAFFSVESASSIAEVNAIMRQSLNLGGDANLASVLEGRRLLVIDDAHQLVQRDWRKLRQFLRNLFDATKPARFLLTCRGEVGIHDIEHVVQLQELRPPADADVLRARMNRNEYEWRDGDEERFRELLADLDGYPLALTIAANLLRKGEASLEDLLRRWKERRTAALQLPGIGAGDLDTLTSVHFALAIAAADLLDAAGRTLLGAQWYLPAGGTQALFDAVIGGDSSVVRQNLQRPGFLKPRDGRYTTLVPVREFAVNVIDAAEHDTVRRRIDEHLAVFAEQHGVNWVTQPRETAAAFAAELPNLHAALDRADARNDHAYIARLTSAMRHFYTFAIPGRQASERLNRGLAAARSSGDRLAEANLLYELGDLGWITGKIDIRKVFGDTKTIYEQLGRRAEVASCLWSLSFADWRDRDYEASLQRNREALAIFEELEDDKGRGLATQSIADAERELERWDDAERHYQEAIEFHKKVRHRVAEAEALRQLGELAFDRAVQQDGDPALLELSARRHREALDAFESASHAQGAAHCRHELGVTYRLQGRRADALRLMEEAIAAFERLGDEISAANARESLDDLLKQKE